MINIKIDGQHSHVKVENVRNPEQLAKELIGVVTSAYRSGTQHGC